MTVVAYWIEMIKMTVVTNWTEVLKSGCEAERSCWKRGTGWVDGDSQAMWGVGEINLSL